jgi:cell division septation protein DedD
MRFAIAATTLLLLAFAARAEGARYWVQIAAAADESAARQRLAEIVQRNARVRDAEAAGRVVVARHVDKRGVFWRVRIGPFEDHEHARQLCGQLRLEGQSCLPAS